MGDKPLLRNVLHVVGAAKVGDAPVVVVAEVRAENMEVKAEKDKKVSKVKEIPQNVNAQISPFCTGIQTAFDNLLSRIL